jgi:hypothetical protein
MKKAMKIRLFMPALLTLSSVSHGQAVPAGVASVTPNASVSGPVVWAPDGVLHYALTGSEIVQEGSGQLTSSSIFSGDAAYSGKSTVRPFSMVFTAGAILPNQSDQSFQGFTTISASQGYITRHWNFNISDVFSFLPQSPTTGLSGIPGVGDIGVIPIEGPGADGGILTESGNRINNGLSGSVERQITKDTSLSGSGSWNVLHYLADDTGLNSTQYLGTVSANRRLDGRSSIGVNAVYTVFNYSGPEAGPLEPDIQSKGINLSYQRVLSRSFSMSGSAGPQWVSSSNSELVPSALNVSINASLAYTHRFTNASVSYSRGVNAGSGVLPGALSNSVTFSGGRSFGRDWTASLNGSYSRSSGLTALGVQDSLVPVSEVFNTVYGGLQVSRRIGTNFSSYLSYTVQDQSTNFSVGALNVLNGISQTFGIGITFTPRSTRLGQF